MLRRASALGGFSSMSRAATRFAATASASASAAAADSAAAGSTAASSAAEASGDNSLQLLDQLSGYYVNIQSRKMYYKDFLRIEHQAVRWAFSDIRKNSEALAHGLLLTGLRPGDRLLAIQPCNCETLVLQLACAKMGAMCVIVPHWDMNPDKLRYYLNQFQPTHFVGREWMIVPEQKGGQVVERNMHFWDLIYNVIPELGLTYPGQKFQWTHSQEFMFLKKTIISDHNMNLLSTTPLRRLLCWGPFSYYEQRLRRLSALLHPDDPILCLQDPKPAFEDKTHVVYSHRNCVNAGYIFSNLLGLQAETRFAVLPNHHINPIGAIVAPYAALTSGAVLVLANDNLFTDEHAIATIEKLCVEEVSGILGRKADFDLLLKHTPNFDDDQYEHIKWVALFEDGLEEPVSQDWMARLAKAMSLDDVFVFRGPIESCYMLTYRSLSKGELGMVPHAEMKVTGDRGTSDAKTLSRKNRGNFKVKGPHMTPYYYSNAGFLSELVDDKGWTSTSRDGTIGDNHNVKLEAAQEY
jgi:fatty-acyl-CoA synthase